MQRGELLVAIAHGKRLRRLDEPARALGVFFNIHVIPSACRTTPGARSAKVGSGFASDRVPNLELARDLIAKPPTLSRITREAWLRHLHWVYADPH
jgi:hypothetical protein